MRKHRYCGRKEENSDEIIYFLKLNRFIIKYENQGIWNYVKCYSYRRNDKL